MARTPGGARDRTTVSESKSRFPYEQALTLALGKLRSEILVFLLAYMILVIGFSVLAPDASRIHRTILFIVPLVGSLAYLWQRPSALVRNAERQATMVATAIGGEEATTIGRRGVAAATAPGNTSVLTGVAGKRSVTIGVDTSPELSRPEDEGYLLELFRRLGTEGKGELVRRALELTAGTTPRG